ncbi:MAG: hypothetical protein GY703_22665 [Gammaproteobacteria bacterium]|nr:hypothetical protein [Gammaproteobacteria bacterium]
MITSLAPTTSDDLSHFNTGCPFSATNSPGRRFRRLLILVAALMLSACASNPYQPLIDNMTAVKARAESQKMGEIRVNVAVPSPEETMAIFDLPLYDRGVQPVWIEVTNGGATQLRYAPFGTDPDYVPPFEVAYTNKAGFSKAAHRKMERYLHKHTMPRTIEPGQVQSGFVFTQARPGTKGVNIDLFGPAAEEAYSLLFFVTVPGFAADHAQVNFEALYTPAEMAEFDLPGFRKALTTLPCCSSDRSGGREGDPLNLVLVGNGDDVLQALLRAGWFERLAAEQGTSSTAEAAYLYGRTADAVFRTQRPGTGPRSELRLWKAPMRVDGKSVWLGDAVHYIASPDEPNALDPDIDDARDFFLQDLWYSQGLAGFAWLQGPNVVSIEQPRQDIMGANYFTDGYRVVLWSSGKPVSMLKADYISWDKPPKR